MDGCLAQQPNRVRCSKLRLTSTAFSLCPGILSNLGCLEDRRMLDLTVVGTHDAAAYWLLAQIRLELLALI